MSHLAPANARSALAIAAPAGLFAGKGPEVLEQARGEPNRSFEAY